MLNTHRHLPLGLAGHKYQMNFISDVVINLLAYRVGVCVLGFLSDGGSRENGALLGAVR